MVVEILGVVKLVPVVKAVPPLLAAYQFIVPKEAAASVTVPVPQIAPPVVELIVGIGFTVASTAVLLAVVHPFKVAST